MSQVVLEVSGMTCAACSASVTEALEKVPNVSLVSVSLLTNEAKVTYDPPTTPTMLILAIEDCGFDAKLMSVKALSLITTTVSILGMTCAACSGSITEALMHLKGVRDASVSLITSSGKIIHDSTLTVAEIISAIEDCGFDAVVESTTTGKAIDSSKTVRTTFHVTGMTCGACSASITAALTKIPGVYTASVSQLTEVAVVEHNAIISPEELKIDIQDCGFNATMTASSIMTESSAVNAVPQDAVQDLILQVYGLDKNSDLSAFEYNVEAVFASLSGVVDSQFIFKGQVDAEELANSSEDQDPENMSDELRVSLNTTQTGIRTLVDALNGIDERYQFVILNSVDQSLNSQLKLLSKIKEIQYWRTNFFASLLFGIPVIILALTENTKFWRTHMIIPGLYWVSVIGFALTTHILFNLGSVFFKKFGIFFRNRGRNANMDVLVCISTLISYSFSVYSIVLSVWTGQTNKPPKVLFETVAMLVCFVSFGKWIENKAKGATSTALSRLLSLTPTTCQIVTDIEKFFELISPGEDEKSVAILELSTRTIAIDLLQTDDIALVLPGGKVPADGIVLYGTTEVDESVITGETMPVTKKKGDIVIGGTINGPHVFYMRVTGAGKNSQLHQIIDIVKESQIKKAPIQRFADYIAARFVVGVLIMSALTLIVWITICLQVLGDKLPKAFMMEENGKYFVCLKLAISVVVVACPCALGLAAPTAVMVGTGVGAQHGVLIKGGDILEKASGVNVILFDKTGTLTTGEMSINNFMKDEKIPVDLWWNLLGSVEVNSEHPTGQAIVKYAKEQLGLNFEDDTFDSLISGFEVIMGFGVRATITIDNESYDMAVGNTKMVVKFYPEAREKLAAELEKELGDSTMTVAHVVINKQYCGNVELWDTIKPNARDVVDYLQHVEHYQVGIVTGDNKAVAETIGARLGVPKGNIFSEVSPIDKDKVVVDLRERFGGPSNICIAFVGDGINDAPALVQADIGMAISSGTEIAIDSAEVVLMGSTDQHANDLAGVITALQVSAATFHKIKWNFVCATVYNFVMMPFAMGCFLPLNIMLPPPAAAATMAFSSVSVVVNSLMLKYWKQPNIHGVRFNEEDIGEAFLLKYGTLDQFNAIKKGKLRHFGMVGVQSLFRKKAKLQANAPYEMLPSTP